MSNAPIPADLPADAIGFVTRRPDRPERLASFARNGALMGSRGQEETMDDVRADYAAKGFTLDANGFIRRASSSETV
jgi:hypothetical protein